MSSSFAIATTADIILLSACAFLGNIGKAVTGFGMAITFLFVWNIVDLAGYNGDFKYAVFIQSLSLISVQPLALYNASVIKNSYRSILLAFIPITLISTPLGQLLSEYVPTKTVQAVAGALVGFVAIWEMYDKRNFFLKLCGKGTKEEEGSGGGGAKDNTRESGNDNKDDVVENVLSNDDDVESSVPKQPEDVKAQIAGRGRISALHGEERKPSIIDLAPKSIRFKPEVLVASTIEVDDFASKEGRLTASSSENNDSAGGVLKSGSQLRFSVDGEDEEEKAENDTGGSTTKKNNVESGDDNIKPDNVATTAISINNNNNTPSSSNIKAAGDDVFATKTSKDVENDNKQEFKVGPNTATFVTLLAGGASGFLGGLVAIRGPPLIFYFLHPPHPVSFNKNTQRATATTITFFNVGMRQAFYVYNTFAEPNQIGYRKEEWRLYLSVIAVSLAGAMVGNKIFAMLKDSKDTIRAILSVFLLLSATGLLFSAFRG